jgi:hypothetical protein
MAILNRKDIEAAVPMVKDIGLPDEGVKELYDAIEALVNDAEEATKRASVSRRDMLSILAKPPAKMPIPNALRLVVETGLRVMEAGFAHFEQTTPVTGTMRESRFDQFTGVLKAIEEAYADPNPFTISQASQAVNDFITGKKS